MGWRQRPQFGHIDILGAAQLGHASDGIARMDAKPGAPNDIVPEPQRKQQLRKARHETDDAHLAARMRMHNAEGVAPISLTQHALLREACAARARTPDRTGDVAARAAVCQPTPFATEERKSAGRSRSLWR